MSSGVVLVDSSAWVHFFREEAVRHPAALDVERMLQQQRAATTGLIQIEVLTGARDDLRYEQVAADLEALRQLALEESIFRHAARLRYRLRGQGISVPVVDALIASCAIIHDCELLHCDHHFDLIARHAPLKLYKRARLRAD